MLDPATIPTDDVAKISTEGLGGLSVMALFARYLRSDVKRAEEKQTKINQLIFSKLDAHTATINAQAVNNAEKFINRTEFTDLRNHIDVQFKEQRDFIMQMVSKK